jgi:hypothetical protein
MGEAAGDRGTVAGGVGVAADFLLVITRPPPTGPAIGRPDDRLRGVTR